MSKLEILKLDFRYIFARDGYRCCYTGKSIEALLQDPKIWHNCVAKIDETQPWSNSNAVTVSPGRRAGKLLRSPLLSFPGRLIVICGSMFSEKTTTTRSLLNNYGYALGSYVWVKPNLDNRGFGITCHNKDETPEMKKAREIDWDSPEKHIDELSAYPIVAIDEVQFFGDKILYLIHELLRKGCLVIANGLKLDYKRDLFGVMHYLLAESDEIIHLKAVCSKCKQIEAATRTRRYQHTGPVVQAGGCEDYYAVCPNCDGDANA